MDRLVTERTSLVFGRLVVSGARGALHGKRVALQAEQVHLIDVQQPGIRRTMRRMATRATFRLHRDVLVDERPLLIHVAFETNRVALRQSTNLAERGCAMHVVAVTALNKSLVNAMTVRLRKVSFRSDVTSETEIRLLLDQQVFRFCGVVRRMAVQTTYVVAGVHRTGEVALLVALTMATQATSIRLLLRQALKAYDFRDITAGSDVF